MTRGLRCGVLVTAAVVALIALAGSAAAQKKIQVLQADGRADAKVRGQIDTAVLALAKSTGDQIVPGDITFTDAAAAVGCKPEDAVCKDEVLGMLGVDEIVLTSVTPKPGGFEVAVRRVGKGGASRDAISFVASDKLDKLDTIAPLFSTQPRPRAPAAAPAAKSAAAPAPAPAKPTAPAPAPPPAPAKPAVSVAPTPAPMSETSPFAPPSSTVAEPQPSPIATPSPGLPGPAEPVARPSSRRLPAMGMVGGGAIAVIGIVFWASAAGLQAEIDDAPANTAADLRAIQELEERGASRAGAGNLFVVGGLVLGGISTYYFLKRGRGRTSSARIVPTVFDHGAGLAFTIGGSP